MKHLISIVLKSAWNRRSTLGVTLVAIALSVALLAGIERIRHDARDGFTQSVSGTDLVVGARTSPVQLMLYSVFRIGEASNNIEWESYQHIAAHPQVKWAIPMSLGDSHRGFPVLGTSSAYYEHYRYGPSLSLNFSQGRMPRPGVEGVFEAVLGAEVAQRLGYHLGDRIVLSHGTGNNDIGLSRHDDKPFTVVGILARTGTAVDRTVHVNLEAITAIHLDWQGGGRIPGLSIPSEYVRKFDLAPKQITAVLVGLHQRVAAFKMQRFVNEYDKEALMAVLPGVALDQLWQMIGVVEQTLLAVSAMVVLVGLSGLTAVILAGLNERRRELAILRSVGAGPRDIFLMLVAENLAMTITGSLAGIALLDIVIALAGPGIHVNFGIVIHPVLITLREIGLLGMVIGAGLLAGLIPAYRAYRLSLADGLIPRL